LEVGVAGVETPEIVRIRVLQVRVGVQVSLIQVSLSLSRAGIQVSLDCIQLIRVGIQLSLAGLRRGQASASVGAYPGSVFTRVPGTSTVWPWVRLNRLNLGGPRTLARRHGALSELTLRAAPGFAFPCTPAHPYRLLDHRDEGHR
jgi:hypothetical protein